MCCWEVAVWKLLTWTQNSFLDVYPTHKQHGLIFTPLEVQAFIQVSLGICVCICMCENVRVGGCILMLVYKCVPVHIQSSSPQ